LQQIEKKNGRRAQKHLCPINANIHNILEIARLSNLRPPYEYEIMELFMAKFFSRFSVLVSAPKKYVHMYVLDLNL